jgi:hypothetical protein
MGLISSVQNLLSLLADLSGPAVYEGSWQKK